MSATAGRLHTVDIPDQEILSSCIHCGMCLPVCPTYSLNGLERSSPRGRIRLIKAVADTDLPMTGRFIDEMNFCLDCQACQTVCPAGIKYGQLVEAARAQIFEAGKDRHAPAKKFFFRFVFASNRRIKWLARLVRVYQNTLAKFMDKTGLTGLLPRKLTRLAAISPRISGRFSDDIVPEISSSEGKKGHTVGMLTGCLMNVMFVDINTDTVAVLRRNHCEVVTPKSQGCCGSLPAHNGDFEIARKYARKLIDAFSRYDLDALVVNSAGCSAFMKEYGALLRDDPDYCDRAAQFSAKVKDVCEYLVEIGFEKPATQSEKKITYHDACHLVHTQGIASQPRELIRSISGIELVELNESTWCCGSAGIYNVVRNEDSMKILKRKVDNIAETGAEILVTGNPGCIGQIEYGLKERGLDIKVMHPVSLLNRAYG